jgi:hypothetical protein
MLRICSFLLGAMIAVACTAGTATQMPSATPSATSTATPATPAPTPTSSPSAASTPPVPTATPSPSIAPVAAGSLKVRWRADDPAGIGPVEWLTGVARSGDAFVLVAELPSVDSEDLFAAWSSTDGRAWELAQEFPAGERILALTAGGPGFVASGRRNDDATMWTSVDGRTWQPVRDASLGQGVIAQLVPTASGVVGFGWRYSDSYSEIGALWTSPDGTEWLEATNETGLTVARGLQAVGAYDGRAVAFVEDGSKGLAIWESTGRAEWTRVGTLKDAKGIERVAGGPRGWVALGANRAWSSPDGQVWSGGLPGPDVTADVIADDSGFVAVGSVGSWPGETCGDQRPFAGHTWTSSDGRFWERMPVSREFKTAMALRLIVVDRTLIAYGHRFPGNLSETPPLARWTAALPEVTHPADTSDVATVPKSCGG